MRPCRLRDPLSFFSTFFTHCVSRLCLFFCVALSLSLLFGRIFLFSFCFEKRKKKTHTSQDILLRLVSPLSCLGEREQGRAFVAVHFFLVVTVLVKKTKKNTSISGLCSGVCLATEREPTRLSVCLEERSTNIDRGCRRREPGARRRPHYVERSTARRHQETRAHAPGPPPSASHPSARQPHLAVVGGQGAEAVLGGDLTDDLGEQMRLFVRHRQRACAQ